LHKHNSKAYREAGNTHGTALLGLWQWTEKQVADVAFNDEFIRL
jgi:hypothetical protein